MAKSDSRVFVILGDGECDEGSVWEAAMCAGKYGLANLTAVVDYNKHQAYGSTREVQDLEPFAAKWRAFGFAVCEVDGHDIDALRAAFASLPLDARKPTAIIAHTVKGKGAAFAENNMKWHHKNKVTDAEVESLLAAIGERDA
jgi:transketolase